MADRDRIPSGLPRQFNSTYKQICEQQDPVVIAQSTLRPLRESVKILGKNPTSLINKAACWVKPMVENSLFKDVVNWDEEHQKVDDFVKEGAGDLDGIELAAKAYHQILNKLEAGEEISDVELEMYKQYILNIYTAQVEESIPYSQQHHADADQETIERHLNLVRPHLKSEIEYLAKQLVKHGNVNALRLPNRTKPTEELLDMDIMEKLTE